MTPSTYLVGALVVLRPTIALPRVCGGRASLFRPYGSLALWHVGSHSRQTNVSDTSAKLVGPVGGFRNV